MHKVNVNKVASSKYEIEVELEKEAWKAAQEKAFDKLAKEVKIDGFRPGKAPKDMLKKHVDQGRVFNEAINSVIDVVFRAALEESKLNPFVQPTVDITKVSEDELGLKFVIVTMPEVTLGEYKGLNIEQKPVEVTEEEIEAGLKKHLEESATLTLVERESKLGDTVVIDFEGFVDGVAFDGGKAENYSLELGSKTFIPGFEDQLVGHKAEEDVEVKVTFPTQYVESLAGKDATFKVKIHEVKEKTIPELTDEVVAELNIHGCKTVEELREHERGHVLSSKEGQAKQAVLNEVINKVLDNAKMDEIPAEAIAEEAKYVKENMSQRLAQQGITLEQYLQMTGKTQEQYDEEANKNAEQSLKYAAVMSAIRKAENIAVTDEDVEFELAKMAEMYKMELAKIKEILAPQMDQFRSDMLNRRMQDFLYENNVKK